MAEFYWFAFAFSICIKQSAPDCNSYNIEKPINPGRYDPFGRYNEARFQRVECEGIRINQLLQYINGKSVVSILSVTQSYAENHISPGLFGNFQNLEDISFTNTNITEITKGIFNGLSSLKIIDISSNNISSVEQKSFDNIHSLTVLNMSNNYISNISFLSSDLSNLINTIDLSNNTITDIHDALELKNLKKLNLCSNDIHDLATNSFNGLIYLTDLNLGHNHLSGNLKSDCFSNLSNLITLHLQFNDIPQLPVGIFRNLASLLFLDLSNNNISYIGIGTFAGLTALEKIDLSSNKISYLSENVLLDLHNVKTFFIRNNRVADLNGKYFVEHLKALTLVSLDGNYWNCDKLSEIIRYLNSKQIKLELGNSFRTTNINGIACDEEIKTASSTDSNAFRENNKPGDPVLNQLANFFENDFKRSEFYKFFSQTGEFKKDFEHNFGNFVKRFDEDFVNSKFYKFVKEDLINATRGINKTVDSILNTPLVNLIENDLKRSELPKLLGEISTEFRKNLEHNFANFVARVDEDFVESKFYKFASEGKINVTFAGYPEEKSDAATFDASDLQESLKRVRADYLTALNGDENYLKSSDSKIQNITILLVLILLLILGLTSVLLFRSLNLNKVKRLKLIKSLYRKSESEDPEIVLV